MTLVSSPSIIASGICVTANIVANFKNDSSIPPVADGFARANWIEVTTYVAKFPKDAAKKTAAALFFL